MVSGHQGGLENLKSITSLIIKIDILIQPQPVCL